ncbi:hypothetical protein P152DRAFT_431525 [Eremomyces bilateralis CBS 781.70]|uniref:YTH domain-containing protein n=1 Tax=Eremomyces bilateralis CBS 781.70 TaxID=1392243 RepID=A0A6G1GBF1_9PEZI|nr:uncharacterized protein P152DRAFT_431525 [Eremomyces bilateralis CBS 781.70]KAF1815179.1 hypothetical protein P152DRAFT_431525 [Eremomyces bilateralis CBS 781.70]
MPRGPPRKPKQSGHALWVGNLPPNASIADLKDHFSREATGDIESVFLISKSNCAFVNYRTEASCVAAMRRFHDSRFHTIRLVCRLRKSSVASPITPSTPASSVSPGPSSSQPETDAANETAPDQGEEQADEGVDEVNEAPQSEEAESPSPGNTSRKSIESGADRYFIVKSLTLQDLESSVVTGIWSTQVHNEKTFNKAFETAPNVWLIFSSNKSGEYFGYARMASSVGADSEELLSKLSRNEEEVPESDAPLSYITTSTETAPRGRVVDDSARGTIFWQREDEDADFTADDDLPTESRSDPPASSPIASSSSSTLQEWGRPFRVEWKTTTRVPFYRARGLRNPWNSNREVKIARDGTELETSVGKRLVDLFHARIPSGAPPMPPTRGVSDPTMRMG